ncbi:hypothetical protein IQ03_01077 [Gemmobacter caeni]|uniref:Uncharacterized protein n=1 Tax=Gemmobacter caeni TaxID=589035 RepID=A0A2T6B895_9RHOB|nr:hypothetical protein [Gemmobacter caeni]PTX52287.1 hypothetical protein C8N34_10265 [Gemmobacter caeni]TWJ02660.1 hypothetical protein IQ03_01077 [Gemmobacter caeni]
MSTLELRGARKPGYRSLCRRHHDLGGVDYEYVAMLPDRTAQALLDGGTLRVRLREDARPDQACWRLDVLLNGEVFEGTFLSDDGFRLLTERDDRFPVRIEGGELTLRKHDLIMARHALERAEAAVHAARDRVSTLALEVLGMTGAETELRLATGDGKYEVVLSGGDAYATRHGERWRDLTGAPLTVALARELKGCRDAITALGGDPLAPGRTPAHYGAERDLLRLTLTDGSELVQDAEGRFTATRDGVELPGLTGDKLTLTLAYELEGARAALAQLRPDTTPEPTGPAETPEP